MPEFPASPIPPAEFMEQFLPRAFAEAELPAEVTTSDEVLGVQLAGAEGGEWVLRLADGALAVTPESRADAAFTLVLSVDDWRGALWQGRGGAIGRQAAALFRPGQGGAARAAAAGLGAVPSAAMLSQLKGLDGLIRMVVAGGEGGDWAVGFKLGPGAIPDEATTTISISAEDAAAMERGELNPLEAFMAGRIEVAGDVALVMQLQMAQMQAAAAPPGQSDESDPTSS